MTSFTLPRLVGLLPAEFLEKFEVQGLLGEGAMGVVARIRNRDSGRLAAAKFFKGRLEGGDTEFVRFKREARLMSALIHPNIARVLDADMAGTMPYILFEYIEGKSLRSQLTEKTFPLEETLEVVACILDGLAAAHGADIVHRDLKPENVLMVAGCTPKLTDFGLARVLGAHTRATEAGTVLGTLPFMAPETLRGQDGSPSSDLYSVGVVLFEMIFRSFPRDAGELMDLLRGKPLGPLAMPKVPAIPRGVGAILRALLAGDPAERWRPADAYARELHDLALLGGRATGLDGAVESARREAQPGPSRLPPPPAQARAAPAPSMVPETALPAPVRWPMAAGLAALLGAVALALRGGHPAPPAGPGPATPPVASRVAPAPARNSPAPLLEAPARGAEAPIRETPPPQQGADATPGDPSDDVEDVAVTPDGFPKRWKALYAWCRAQPAEARRRVCSLEDLKQCKNLYAESPERGCSRLHELLLLRRNASR